MNPKLVVAPGRSAPFHVTLLAEAVDPLVVSSTFHAWATFCPAGIVSVTVQPRMSAAPAVTVTSPW